LRRFNSGRRAEKIAGFVVRSQERFDFAAQRGIGSALRGHEFLAAVAGGQGDGLGEDEFGVDRGRVHRTVNPERHCNSGRDGGESKAGGQGTKRFLIHSRRNFRIVSVEGSSPAEWRGDSNH
jgi:hypothetical protein